MTKETASLAQSNLKIALWQVEAESMTSSDLYIWLNELGLPHEVSIRLREIVTYTKKTGSKVIAIGKIVLIKIIEFIKLHPFLVMGAGVGAVIGAAIATLITSIPFLGQLLAPLAIALGITITAVGAVVGHRLDKQFQGVGEDIVEITQEFFKLLANVFNSVFPNVITA